MNQFIVIALIVSVVLNFVFAISVYGFNIMVNKHKWQIEELKHNLRSNGSDPNVKQ